MKTVQKISTLIFVVLYLSLSVGVVLYSSHCDCNNNDNISLFVEPESCSENIDGHACCNNESNLLRIDHQATNHHCGCENPIVLVLRLQNHWSEQDDDIKVELTRQLTIPLVAFLISFQDFENQDKDSEYPHYSPPVVKKAGRSLINFIEQRKIDILS